MKTRDRSEADEWTPHGPQITSPENLEQIRQELDHGPIIIEHWFYRGASAPTRLVFDAFDDFEAYIAEKAWAGDAIDVWSFADLCRVANTIATGKCPAEDGCVPEKGAY